MKAYQDDFDQIAVPAERVDMAIQKAVSKGERRLKVKRRLVTGASAVLLCAGILGSGFVSTSMARVLAGVPFIGSVFERQGFAGSGLKNVDSGDIAKFDDMQITDERGITVAIREVYYDQSGFAVGYVISGPGLSYEEFAHLATSFYYNGQLIPGGSSGWHDKISEDLYVGLVQYHPQSHPNRLSAGLSLPERFELEVVFTDDLNKMKESPFRFKIPVSRRSTDEKTKEALVMKAMDVGDGTILVKKILFTPVSTVVEYEYTHPRNDKKMEETTSYDVKLMDGVKLIDDDGVALEPVSLGRQGSPNGEQWIDACRVDFPAVSEPAGNMAFELLLPDDRRIIVNFAVE